MGLDAPPRISLDRAETVRIRCLFLVSHGYMSMWRGTSREQKFAQHFCGPARRRLTFLPEALKSNARGRGGIGRRKGLKNRQKIKDLADRYYQVEGIDTDLIWPTNYQPVMTF